MDCGWRNHYQKNIKTEPTWLQLGSKNCAQMATKSMQKSFVLLICLEIVFWIPSVRRSEINSQIYYFFDCFGKQHGSNLPSKLYHDGGKIDANINHFCWCLFGSIFNRILMDFWYQNAAQLVPKWNQKSMLTSKGRFYKTTDKTNRIR